MPQPHNACVKCDGPMTLGFMLDFTSDNVHREKALWVEGQRERAVWVGTKLKDKDVRTVDAYRCQKCGFLELYANEQRSDFIM